MMLLVIALKSLLDHDGYLDTILFEIPWTNGHKNVINDLFQIVLFMTIMHIRLLRSWVLRNCHLIQLTSNHNDFEINNNSAQVFLTLTTIGQDSLYS